MRLVTDGFTGNGLAFEDMRLQLGAAEGLGGFAGGIHPQHGSGPNGLFVEHAADAKQRLADTGGTGQGDVMDFLRPKRIVDAAPERHEAGIERAGIQAADDLRNDDVLVDPLPHALDGPDLKSGLADAPGDVRKAAELGAEGGRDHLLALFGFADRFGDGRVFRFEGGVFTGEWMSDGSFVPFKSAAA